MAVGVWVAASVMALIYWVGFVGRAGTPWAGSVVKTAAVALLAVAGAVMGAPGLIVAGLALGAVGDLALSRPGQRAFLAGMAAFAAGHLAYAAQFWGAAGSLAVWQAVGLLGLALSTEVWLAPHTGALRWPVRGYVGVIVAMAALAVALPPGSGVVQVGVLLFVLSDFVLALRMFRGGGNGLAHVVWPAYWAGQALILWGSV